MFIGFGTVVNIATITIGSLIGMALGDRLPDRTSKTVTDGLGLVTLMVGALSVVDVTSPVLRAKVGPSAPVLIVLGAMLVGGIIGSLVDLEGRLEGFGGWMQRRFVRSPDEGTDGAAGSRRERFIRGFVSASLIYCIGPLTILGSLSDGLGRGADQLLLKSVLDGFLSIAFAASLGVGVLASAIGVAVFQGTLTLAGFLLGDFLPEAHLYAITATGGLLLLGVAIRLLDLKQVPVANLLPALVVAPLLVQAVAAVH